MGNKILDDSASVIVALSETVLSFFPYRRIRPNLISLIFARARPGLFSLISEQAELCFYTGTGEDNFHSGWVRKLRPVQTSTSGPNSQKYSAFTFFVLNLLEESCSVLNLEKTALTFKYYKYL